jgi:hypothetical protein
MDAFAWATVSPNISGFLLSCLQIALFDVHRFQIQKMH